MSCRGTRDPPPANLSRQPASKRLIRSARLKASSDWRATPLRKYSIQPVQSPHSVTPRKLS